MPIIQHYEKLGLVKKIQAIKSPEQVFEEVQNALTSLGDWKSCPISWCHNLQCTFHFLEIFLKFYLHNYLAIYMHGVATDHACESFSRVEKTVCFLRRRYLGCQHFLPCRCRLRSQCYFRVERFVTSEGRGSFVGDLLFYSFWGFVFQTGKVELFMKRVDLSGYLNH